MIVQAIGLLDDLDKELNTYAMRVREWYGWHFPEMTKIVSDNIVYAKAVSGCACAAAAAAERCVWWGCWLWAAGRVLVCTAAGWLAGAGAPVAACLPGAHCLPSVQRDGRMIAPGRAACLSQIKHMGTRDKAAGLDFSGVLPEEVEAELKDAAVISMGTEISAEDLDNISALADQVRPARWRGWWRGW
jgi:hypothetical protein